MLPTIHIVSVLLTLTAIFSGCSASGTNPQEPLRTRPQERVIALVDGMAITRDTLDSGLYELAGDEVLAEFVLDRALVLECRARDISIDRTMIEQERALLSRTLDLSPGSTEPARPEIIDTLRARRGLGPDRFERLLKRNAMLRALTKTHIEPDPRAVEHTIERTFGPKYRIRLLVANDADLLADVRNRVNAREPIARSVEFANACFEHSLHPSGDRGGLIASLSTSDPAYPASMLNAIENTQIGACSPIVSTEVGLAIVLVEQAIPATTPSENQKSMLIERLGNDLQRIEMQRYAQELLAQHEVIAVDRSLNWAWANRP